MCCDSKFKYKLAQTWLEPNFHVPNSRNNFFGIMVPGFYLKRAIFTALQKKWPQPKFHKFKKMVQLHGLQKVWKIALLMC